MLQALTWVHGTLHDTNSRSTCYCLVWLCYYDSIEEAGIRSVHVSVGFTERLTLMMVSAMSEVSVHAPMLI
jgi:hypothetical protein